MSKQFGRFITEELLSEIGVIEVGIFEANPRKKPQRGKKKFAKGVARNSDLTKITKLTTADLLEDLEYRYQILSRALENQTTKEYGVFVGALIEYANDGTSLNHRKIKNSLKAVIVKPILTSMYGYNTQETADKKGFNKLLVDTGQTVKAIEVRINGN